MTTATATPLPPGPLDGETYRLTLPNTAAAPRIARDFVTSLLNVNRHPGLVDDARLCVSEVVTNAHQHTCSPLIRVQVTVGPDRVTIQVADNAPAAPTTLGVPYARTDGEHGWGLFLVNRLALTWGANVLGGHAPGRKTVWFVLGGRESTP
ncbi:ATP-binding protein [Streptomyces sp. NPDC056061]|uniref:ATP-binding protein n=1 Tax=Streptomyces sp. NPDC056061 TaxID=3345700 RepID=UPI0035D9FD07